MCDLLGGSFLFIKKESEIFISKNVGLSERLLTCKNANGIIF